jgi:hypothetical protein
MTFNLFGPPTKDDIRVGYIDPDRGLVEGVTICQANEYAIKNPGTTFVFRNGNNIIQYLNINEVNNIDPNILNSTDQCGGINQRKECGPPTIQFFGGGGIGAAGNPVVGRDGALLAVDVVRGGNGYQYPPIIAARDNCNYGSGATLTAVLGEVTETIETYENESDFEDYEICEPTDVGYGLRYGPNGEPLGPWEPRSYTDPGEDPIRKEVDEFQEIVRRLGRKPFFSTIKNRPTKIVCSDPKVLPQVYDVRTKWGPESFNPNEFMSSYAISPVSPSNVPGSDFAGRLFTFEWTEDFLVDGEYIFRMLCDNVADLYIDNLKVKSIKNMWGSTTQGGAVEPVTTVKKNINKGIHKVRVDLLNLPFYETRTTAPQQPASTGIDVNFNVRGDGAAAFTHNFKVNGLGIDVFKPRKTPLNQNVTGKAESGKVYEVEFFVNGSPGGSITIKNNGLRIEMEDGGGKNPVDASVNISQGKFFNAKGNKCSFVVGEPVATPPAPRPAVSTSSNQSNIQIKKVFSTVDFISRANRTLWRSKVAPVRDADFVNKYGVLPFDPDSAEAQTQSFTGTHTIVWNDVDFPVDGSYNIELWADDRVTLTITNGSGFKEIIRKEGFTRGTIATGKSVETRTLKAGKYRIQADLFQGNAAPLASPNNPMILAVNIDTPTVTETVISSKSWNENAMAIALTIDAPEPPIPQEPKPEQEGRCPNNPIWSTRFPGAKEFWYPVRYSEALRASGITEWSDFLNRYAISPVKPLDIPGSDAGGILFTNTWDIDIPYDGFYKFAVQRDETARIFVDGKLAFDVTTAGDDIWRDFRNKPKFQKVFIAKGRHTIEIELENRVTETFDQVNQLIFRTADWQTGLSQAPKTVDVDFNVKTTKKSSFASTFKIQELEINVPKPSNAIINQTIQKKVQIGKVYTIEIDIPNSNNVSLFVRGNTLEVEDLRANTARDLFVTISKGRFFEIQNGAKKATCKFIIDDESGNNATPAVKGITSGTKRNGVTYEGPTIIHHKDTRWNAFMNFQSVSPIVPGNPPDSNGRKRFTWKGVRFPESGQYDIRFLADNDAKLFIGGREVLRAQGFAENPQIFKVNITQGTYDIVVDSEYPYTTSETNTEEYFRDINPTGFGLAIRKNVTVRKDYGKSWVENPIAISAILIPPPCPRRIRGRGVVTDVIVNDPGNGYLRPIPQDQGYPVALRLKEVIVENPGINYNCGVDELRITPNNGAELDYICDPFGKIREVKVLNPGLGFTEYPEIRLISETGVNATFRPVFEVVRDPIVLPERLIQVTDLVGLKQTGYVDGRAYYGAVYYDQGVRFAGFYETVGEPVRVYDTLQESITGEVTTRPSAIERQGTDITNNDPRLNLPRTPENLI